MSEALQVDSIESVEPEFTPEELAIPEVLTPIEKKRINKIMLKYNGQSYEETLPFEIDDDPKIIEYLTKQAQLAKMSQSSAQNSASLEKEVLSFLQELKTNPRKALQNPMIGIDIKQLAADILEEEIENSRKSPEQLKIEAYEARLKAVDEERAKEKQDAETARYEQVLERSD